nr:baseplate J/gp47 family protein [uncultured Oscillibacter sp.]
MIDLTGKNYTALLAAMLDRVPNTYDKRDTSPIQTALGPAAWALEGYYLILDQVQRSAFIQTAAGQPLDYLAVIGGLTRYPASAAVRLGVFDAPVPAGARFSTIGGADSINFVVTAATETAGEYHLTAETPGAIGNEYTGPILPITTIPGLTSAVLAGILIPGDEEEDDEALRARLIEALNEKPFGGNIASYRTFINGLDGVGGVQIYPTWNGGGTVKCSVLGADLLPASPTLVEKVQLAVDPPPNQGLGLGTAPIGARVTVTAPTAVTVDVSAELALAPGISITQVQPLVEGAVERYLLEIRRAWATPVNATTNQYASDVYLSRILAAIVGTTGVINARGAVLNGAAEDLALQENGTAQEVPVLGTVTLHV